MLFAFFDEWITRERDKDSIFSVLQWEKIKFLHEWKWKLWTLEIEMLMAWHAVEVWGVNEDKTIFDCSSYFICSLVVVMCACASSLDEQIVAKTSSRIWLADMYIQMKCTCVCSFFFSLFQLVPLKTFHLMFSQTFCIPCLRWCYNYMQSIFSIESIKWASERETWQEASVSSPSIIHTHWRGSLSQLGVWIHIEFSCKCNRLSLMLLILAEHTLST